MNPYNNKNKIRISPKITYFFNAFHNQFAQMEFGTL